MAIKINRRWWLAGWIISIMMAASAAYADEKPATTDTLVKLTEQWVQLNEQINSETLQWQEEKQTLQNIKQLLTKEIARHKETIENLDKQKRGYNKERLALMEKKKAYEKILIRCQPVIDAAEVNVLNWQAVIPEPFQADYDRLFIQVKKGRQQPLSHRLQRLLAIYAKLEHDQAMIHHTKQVIKVSADQTMEFDVLYFGFAQALSVSAGNEMAGIAKPADEGWQWSWTNQSAPSIRTAVDYYQHHKIADFVELPVILERETH